MSVPIQSKVCLTKRNFLIWLRSTISLFYCPSLTFQSAHVINKFYWHARWTTTEQLYAMVVFVWFGLGYKRRYFHHIKLVAFSMWRWLRQNCKCKTITKLMAKNAEHRTWFLYIFSRFPNKLRYSLHSSWLGAMKATTICANASQFKRSTFLRIQEPIREY